MSDEGPFRQLYVLATEAIEAEARRLIEEQQAAAKVVAPLMSGPVASDYEYALKRFFKDETIFAYHARDDIKMIVGHLCQVCGEAHRTSVNETAASKQELVDRVVSRTRQMLESACKSDLGTMINSREIT